MASRLGSSWQRNISCLFQFSLKKTPSFSIQNPKITQKIHGHWVELPEEIHQLILDFVGNPTLTARIDTHCRKLSLASHTYQVLLDRYERYIFIASYLKLPEVVTIPIPLESPTQHSYLKVKALYRAIIMRAQRWKISLEAIQALKVKSGPLCPTFFLQVKELILKGEKAAFFRAVNGLINPALPWPAKVEDALYIGERRMRAGFILVMPFQLNLEGLGLTHLPPQIGLIKSMTLLNLNNNQLASLPPEMKSLTQLMNLSLRGNPLSAENVKDICMALISLNTVNIDNAQVALAEMFRKDFPQIHLIVTQIHTVAEM